MLINADGALLLWSENAKTIIAAPGDEAPGGGTFTSISSGAVNASGDVVFTAELTPRDSQSSSSFGLFQYSAGQLVAVLVDGSPGPDGGIFRSFDQASINAHGVIRLSVRRGSRMPVAASGRLATGLKRCGTAFTSGEATRRPSSGPVAHSTP